MIFLETLKGLILIRIIWLFLKYFFSCKFNKFLRWKGKKFQNKNGTADLCNSENYLKNLVVPMKYGRLYNFHFLYKFSSFCHSLPVFAAPKTDKEWKFCMKKQKNQQRQNFGSENFKFSKKVVCFLEISNRLR